MCAFVLHPRGLQTTSLLWFFYIQHWSINPALKVVSGCWRRCTCLSATAICCHHVVITGKLHFILLTIIICNGLHIKYQICNKFWLAVTVCRVDGNATCLVWTQFRGTTGHGLHFGIIDFHLTSHCLLKSQRTRISINGRLTVQIKSLSLCPYFCNSC